MRKIFSTEKDFVSYSAKLAIILCWNGFAVVSIWRGLWVLQDYYFFPDDDNLSNWTSGILATVLLVFILLIRLPLNSLTVFVNNWNYFSYPNVSKFVCSFDLNKKEEKHVYFYEASIKKEIIIEQETNLTGSINDEKKIEESHLKNEETALIPKKKKLTKKIFKKVAAFFNLCIGFARFLGACINISFWNSLIMISRISMWFVVMAYYWIIGFDAVAYHRWIWNCWDFYTAGDYFPIFIFISIIIPTLMLIPCNQEFINYGGTPITIDEFGIKQMALFRGFTFGKQKKKIQEKEPIFKILKKKGKKVKKIQPEKEEQ